MRTASSLSWRPIAELPDELLEQLRSDATLEVRRDGRSRSDRRWQLLFIPGLAGLIAGVLAGVLIPTGPLPSPVRLAVLAVGAVTFAMWLAWFRGRSERPLAGQGVLLTPSTLVVVDHTSVAVVRAEHVDVEAGNLVIAKELIHRADEIMLDQLAAAREADLDTRKADPWRPLAGAAGGRPVPTPRTRRLGRAAIYGAIAAVALEAVFALAIGWPASASRDRAWAHSVELLDKQLAQIDRYQERAFVELLGDADSVYEMTGLLEQAVELGDGSDRAQRVLQRYRIMLSDELARQSSLAEVHNLLTHARAVGLADADQAPIRNRMEAIVLERYGASTDAREIAVGLGRLAEDEVVGRAREQLLARLAAVVDANVTGTNLDTAAELYHELDELVPPDHPMRAALIARVREFAAAELPTVTDTRALYLRFYTVRRLVDDDPLKKMIDDRFEALVREQVATIHDTSTLLEYYQLHLNRAFNQFLTERYEVVARDEIRRARTADDIDHFREEFKVLHVGGELEQLLESRLAELEGRP